MRYVIRDSQGNPQATQATSFEEACQKVGFDSNTSTGEALVLNEATKLPEWINCTPKRKPAELVALERRVEKARQAIWFAEKERVLAEAALSEYKLKESKQ